MRIATPFLLALILALPGSPGLAKNPHGKHAGGANGVFSTPEVEVLQGYYVNPSGKQKRLPPGLQKKLARGGALPPGWQKKYAVGQVLPVDVYRIAEPAPRVIVARLPPQPPNSAILQLDTQVVRVDRGSMRVTAVFDF